MARRRTTDRHIFFPWERRGGLLRRIRFDQARPFLFVVTVAALVLLVGVRERRKSGVRRTHAILLNVRTAVDSYMADHDGGCPPGGLEALKGADGVEEVPKDAWGKPLRLDCPGRDRARYDLTSDGPDGKRGGLDRIE
jgi:general secretion pathway protein G